VGVIDGELRVDPSLQEMQRSTLDLVYAGTKDRVLMYVSAVLLLLALRLVSFLISQKMTELTVTCVGLSAQGGGDRRAGA
jgi:polyribonucleotide nucleotidyltransferase